MADPQIPREAVDGERIITRTSVNSDIATRVSLGVHRPTWEIGECPSCGSAPCGPHPDFLICVECDEDWPCQTVSTTATELERIADGLRVHTTLKMPGVSDRAGRFAQTAVDDVRAELRTRAAELRAQA